MTKLKKTPLYKKHVTQKGTMVDFGGWSLPVQYKGIIAEHKHTREAVSVFDISHMGEFIVDGKSAAKDLDNLLTMSVSDMKNKTCKYGAMLNEQGGIIDDLIVFRIQQDKWFIVVNSATTEKDAAHIKKNLSSDCFFSDISAALGKIDVQGPLSRDVLKEHVDGIEKLKYYRFDYFDLLGQNVLISRTGYTGELGYEIYYPWEQTPDLWNALLKDKRVKPAGLGARDVLRLEQGYSLYGHELAENITPLEAGLNRFIDVKKDFIGKDTVVRQSRVGLKRRLAGIISESRKAPRQGQKIFSEEGKPIGVVTSGTFSPCLTSGIGLGFIMSAKCERGEKVLFGDDKKKTKATVSSRFFYKEGSLKD